MLGVDVSVGVNVFVDVRVGVSVSVSVDVKVDVQAAAVFVTASDVIVAACSTEGAHAVEKMKIENTPVINIFLITRASRISSTRL